MRLAIARASGGIGDLTHTLARGRPCCLALRFCEAHAGDGQFFFQRVGDRGEVLAGSAAKFPGGALFSTPNALRLRRARADAAGRVGPLFVRAARRGVRAQLQRAALPRPDATFQLSGQGSVRPLRSTTERRTLPAAFRIRLLEQCSQPHFSRECQRGSESGDFGRAAQRCC